LIRVDILIVVVGLAFDVWSLLLWTPSARLACYKISEHTNRQLRSHLGPHPKGGITVPEALYLGTAAGLADRQYEAHPITDGEPLVRARLNDYGVFFADVANRRRRSIGSA